MKIGENSGKIVKKMRKTAFQHLLLQIIDAPLNHLLPFFSFDEETNEVQATLTSNFTKAPMTLSGEFINQTDPTTLNRHVGTKWSFSFDKIYVRHELFYKNTYEYWALGTELEYSKGRVASMDLKIQYEPQVFDLVMKHPPTKTEIIAKGRPSLPQLQGEMNITHGDGSFKFDAYGMIDIAKYEMVGNFRVDPNMAFVEAKAKLEPSKRKFWVSNAILSRFLCGNSTQSHSHMMLERRCMDVEIDYLKSY